MPSPISLSSISNSVRFSKLNSEIMFSPDRSENGKNDARNSRMRPQKTVFWAREKRFSKSLHILSKLFLHDENIQFSFQMDTFFSTYENIASHCSNVTASNTSPNSTTGMVDVAISSRHAAIDRVINASILSVSVMASFSKTSRNAWSKMVFFSPPLPLILSNCSFSAEMSNFL